jgi:type II secretory pathway component PulC
MRTGDVVKGVDGQEYGGPEDAELFLRRLAQGGQISVLIERRGQPIKLDVLIE